MAKKKTNNTAKKAVEVKEVKEVKVAPVAPVADKKEEPKKAAPVAKKAPAKKPAAKKAAAPKKADNTVKVEFSIEVIDPSVETVYVCGNDKAIGNWEADKALAIKKNADGKFVASKAFEAGKTVEFKVLAAKDWAKVEKGMQCEEICNHTVYAAKDAVAALVVYNWAE